MTARTSIIIACISMIIMIILYLLTTLGYMGPNPVGEASTYNEPLVVPAGYAFSIWSVIYLTMIIFPFYHLFNQDKRQHPLWIKVRNLYSLNIIANGLWLVCASYSWQVLTVIIIFFMLYTLYRINDLLITINSATSEVDYWIERIGFSMYFAWITLASALNISSALAFYEFDGWGMAQEYWAIGFLIVVPMVAGYVFMQYRDRAFAGVVVWAFMAIIMKNWEIQPSLAYLSMAVLVLFIYLWLAKGVPFQKLNNL